MSEGIFVKNTTKPSDVAIKVFVRADTWYYYDYQTTIYPADRKFVGNEHMSLAAPIMLGRWYE